MSITRFFSAVAVWVTALVLAPQVQAQLFKPFAFPQPESDFQFFAPAEVDTYGGGPAQKTGWFATYDRIYMNVSRPEDVPQLTNRMGDFTWGNRIDLGFVDDDDHKGWLVTILHVNGPNENVVVETERINRYMAGASPEAKPILPISDNNNRLTGARDYFVTDSVNVADMTGVELNRTWQLDQLHHGTRLTPLVGLRYIKFVDFYQRDTYLRFDDTGFPVPPMPPSTAITATTEQLISLQAGVQNDMLGGQLGVHWDRDYRRWNFSGDFKALALENFQYWNDVTKVETTIYDAFGTGAAPTAVLQQQNGTAYSNQEFVFGMELRFDAAFRVTRDFSLRAGAEFLDFGKGIGRGINRGNTSQDVLMYGFSLGLTYNR